MLMQRDLNMTWLNSDIKSALSLLNSDDAESQASGAAGRSYTNVQRDQ